MAYLASFINDDEGQDMVEYALLLTLVGIVCILAIVTIGTKVASMWSQISVPLT
jgi:pilus assembly protein Flp/PilA